MSLIFFIINKCLVNIYKPLEQSSCTNESAKYFGVSPRLRRRLQSRPQSKVRTTTRLFWPSTTQTWWPTWRCLSAPSVWRPVPRETEPYCESVCTPSVAPAWLTLRSSVRRWRCAAPSVTSSTPATPPCRSGRSERWVVCRRLWGEELTMFFWWESHHETLMLHIFYQQ